MVVIVVMGMSIFLEFPLASAQSSSSGIILPPAFQQKDIFATAVVRDGFQEVNLLVTQSRYEPNMIAVKRGIPLKIHVTTDETAGCAREIVFPDFGIRRIIPQGQIVTLELLPQKEGTFRFHCSMDMARGKIVVVS